MTNRRLGFEALESRQLLTELAPAQVREFYGLTHVYNRNPATKGAGVSIAVVVAYDDPTAAKDVTNDFDRPYHLSALSLTTYNLGPAGNETATAWSAESEADVEMVHTIAPLAHIDLVEASDDGLQEMMEANQYAAALPGVVLVSDSWGVPEFTTENRLDADMSAPGVTFVAASGDFGVPDYPAVSPAVIAVGGTWVSGSHQVAWPRSGAGTSQVYPDRHVPDVRMAVNSAVLTGTSVSAPLFAGLVGIADALRQQQGLPALNTASVRSRMASVTGTSQYHAVFNAVASAQSANHKAATTAGLDSPKAVGLIRLLSDS